MSEKELMSQVLYLEDGEEKVAEPETDTEAHARAHRMSTAGYEVLAILDADKTESYLNRPRPMDALNDGQTFPIEEYKKAHRDVEPEVADSLDMPDGIESKPMEAVEIDREAAQRYNRISAIEFALKMYGGEDNRSAEELVADAQTILDFING